MVQLLMHQSNRTIGLLELHMRWLFVDSERKAVCLQSTDALHYPAGQVIKFCKSYQSCSLAEEVWVATGIGPVSTGIMVC
jgi:hypothetical protein